MYIERAEAIELLCKLSREPHYQHEGEDYYVGIAEASGEIYSMPAADVVEVVRCKDCRISENSMFGENWRFCKNNQQSHKVDHFCGYGERKDTNV